MDSLYYDATKILSLLDKNGNKPEIYIVDGVRTGGKTTFFNRLLINNFLKKGKKFGLLYRFNEELSGVEDKFFKDIKTLFFNEYKLEGKMMNKAYKNLYLTKNNGTPINCGYAVAINAADKIKKHSHLLNDVESLLFDEFQSESNHYCPDEIIKFQSIHASLARGINKQVRYLPVYMLSNFVSLLNPYYHALGISSQINDNTKYLKGNGFVLERYTSENLNKLQKESGFNQAFSNSLYQKFLTESVYLNDNKNFVENIKGKYKYIATLKYKGDSYSLKEFQEQGIIYCDSKIESTCKSKLSITTNDHNINYLMLEKNSLFISRLRLLFEKGCFRFANLECKKLILDMISY